MDWNTVLGIALTVAVAAMLLFVFMRGDRLPKANTKNRRRG
jgi:hypothetical protein